jgi:hypothetical protein
MSYLETVKRLEEELSCGVSQLETLNVARSDSVDGTATDVMEYEKYELYEKSPQPEAKDPGETLRAFIQRFDCAIESLDIDGRAVPSKPCYCCKSRKFWLSVHGAFTCAACHPSGALHLVRAWFELPDTSLREREV